MTKYTDDSDYEDGWKELDEWKVRAEAAAANVAFLTEQIEKHVQAGIRLGERAEAAEAKVKALTEMLEEALEGWDSCAVLEENEPEIAHIRAALNNTKDNKNDS